MIEAEATSESTSAKERARWAIAQRRRRARAKCGEAVFRVALHSQLVALALSTSRFAVGHDLTSHEQCEAALGLMIEQTLFGVIDDCTDDDVRAMLSGIKAELSSKVNSG